MIVTPRLALDKEVRSCLEAANARGIPLSLELKTLLLRADGKLMAVHLRGGDRLNNRLVKKACNIRNLAFETLEQIRAYGLEKGIINPWTVPKQAMHVVDTAVMKQSVMTTNNGTLTGSMLVNIQDLLTLNHVRIEKIRESDA
ncbi:MAG: YbaK/EbsC family protein [Desulfovibrio sp.]